MNRPADGPEPSPGYAVVAFEVRLACGGRESICGATRDGLTRVIAARNDLGANRRVVALAWFAEELSRCPDTHWRLIAGLDTRTGRWSAWVAEER